MPDKKFTRAIVRKPCRNIVKAISSSGMGPPDYEKALEQHSKYVEALESCGLEVVCLPPDEKFPDSVFVEDTALLTPECAIVTNPGASSRKGETGIIRETLKKNFNNVRTISEPGTVDAGDIMMAGNKFYIGRSERTNLEGIRQVAHILEKYSMEAIPVDTGKMLHLKTGVSYLENNLLLTAAEFYHEPEFRHFKKLEVKTREAYAANSVWINNTVLVPSGYPETRALIESRGLETIPVDTSQFLMIDGGLSCLSLRF